ncbi:OmpA family protein [uncultured Paracoccus sp.]|uniref:peptidoglycan-associated lipoprotein n=1 Tax=uncultured Paracoccus sp. TaxID=189685 RepID=UPI00260DF21C|nr:OmpA family protein [uncultured Paracoccus sp.]
MTTSKPAFLLLLALTLAGCAAPPPPAVVTDPYAGLPGGGAVYTAPIPDGTLGGTGTADYFRTTLGDTVLFPRDQAALTAEARLTLARQADWLKTNGSFSTVVEGHSDEQGTREFNLALGARRAGAVEEYLISQGVPAGRIRTVSYGKERPVAVCSDEECLARNRRAVTVVQPGAGV